METKDLKNALEFKLIQKALKNEKFRESLINHPKDTIERELGITIPASLSIKVVEEIENEVILVIPSIPKTEDQLSLESLESVSGGWTGDCPGTSNQAKCD
jgi:hypothetical protein